MSNREARLALPAVLLAICSCQGPAGSTSGVSDPLQEFKAAAANGPEAKNWLKSNRHTAALASNRFGSTDEALEFVEQLYSAGAVKVVVLPSSIIAEPDLDGDYADALIVVLPDESSAMARVLAIGNAEAARDGMELGPETKQGLMFLWWD